MNRSPVNYPNSGIPQVQGWPQNLMPPRFQGFPSGPNRSDTDAEMLLSSAVAWWDASQYRDGGRFLKNQGTAGELLDARLGSSDRVATTNDPFFLRAEDEGYMYLPGVNNNNATTPDSPALDITGDLEIVCKVAMDDWYGSLRRFVNKSGATPPESSYEFFQSGTRFYLSTSDGTTSTQVESNAPHSFQNGQVYWIKVTLDVDNGAGGANTSFYWAYDSIAEPSSWTQIGTAVTTAGVRVINNCSTNLFIGDRATLNRALWGKFYRVIIRNGIGGTVALDADFTNLSSSATSFTESSANAATVTINRSTSGRKTVVVPSRQNGGRSCFLFGTDDYMEVQDSRQHQILNFESGQPYTILSVVRTWQDFSTTGGLLSKTNDHSNGSLLGQRWSLRTTVSNNYAYLYEDGNRNQFLTSPLNMVPTWGTLEVFSFSATSSEITPRRNNVLGAILNRPSGHIYNEHKVNIGRATSGAVYGNHEFYAAAIFRRALTPAEIATIVRYYGDA